ncbi:MAG: hypothetical protein HQM11_12110 [SAR324 cluster bacterium]|nr:hypothetical protein [SAR324 cluster bacterium]
MTFSKWKISLFAVILLPGLVGIYFGEEIASLFLEKTNFTREILLPQLQTSSLKNKLLWVYPLDRDLKHSDDDLLPFHSVSGFHGIQLSAQHFVKIPNLSDFDFRNDFSFSFWFIPNGANLDSLNNILWIGDPAIPDKPYFSLWYGLVGGSRQLHISSVLGKSFITSVFQENQFYQLTLSYQAQTRILRLFVNGQEIPIGWYESGPKFSNSSPLSTVFQIARGFAPVTEFSGIYGGLVFWHRTLDVLEIQNMDSWRKEKSLLSLENYTEDVLKPQLQTSSLRNNLLWFYPLQRDLNSALGGEHVLNLVKTFDDTLTSPSPQFRSLGLFKGIQLSHAHPGQISRVHDFNYNNDFSLSFWVIPVDFFIDPRHFLKNIIWIGNSDNPGSPYFSMWYGDERRLHISGIMGKKDLFYELKSEQFYHFKLIYNRGIPAMNLLINDQSFDLPVMALNNESITEPNVFYFAKGFSPETGFSGIYGAINFWKRILTTTEYNGYAYWIEEFNNRLGLIRVLSWGLIFIFWLLFLPGCTELMIDFIKSSNIFNFFLRKWHKIFTPTLN